MTSTDDLRRSRTLRGLGTGHHPAGRAEHRRARAAQRGRGRRRRGFVSSVGPFVAAVRGGLRRSTSGSRYAIACATGTAALHVAMLLLGRRAGRRGGGRRLHLRRIGEPGRLLRAPARCWSTASATHLEPGRRPAGRRARRPGGAGRAAAQGRSRSCTCWASRRTSSRSSSCATGTASRCSRTPPSRSAPTGRLRRAGRPAHRHGRQGRRVLVQRQQDRHGRRRRHGRHRRRLALAQRARHLTTQAKVPDVGYLHDEVGYNYRLTNIAAALGLAQLERLPEFVARKRELAARYDAALAGDRPGAAAAGGRHGRDVLAVLGAGAAGRRPRRTRRSAGRPAGARCRAPVRCGGRCTRSRPSRRRQALGGAVGDDLFARGVSLPCSTTLTDDEQQQVIDAVLDVL